MPSKLGFGNSRTPMTKKVSYGSAMHYKNPVKKKTETKIGGTTIVGPFTEAELTSAKKMEEAGRKGYSGKSGGFTDQDYKNYQKVHGKGANPNVKPYGMSLRSDND